MIAMPRRSVTRFFIPLIDVMTLLFCIFLLMPIFNEAKTGEEEQSPDSTNFRQRLDIERLNRQLREARAKLATARVEQDPLTRQERDELNRLRKEHVRPLQQRYAIFLLGIDARNGQLFYYDPDEADKKHVIATEQQARELIARERKEAGGRDLYFLFQVPRRKSPYPQVKQRKEYERWFKSVPHGFGSPSGNQ